MSKFTYFYYIQLSTSSGIDTFSGIKSWDRQITSDNYYDFKSELCKEISEKLKFDYTDFNGPYLNGSLIPGGRMDFQLINLCRL